MKWNMIAIGAGIGIALIIIDEMLRLRNCKFRAHVMPVAIGIYLPIFLSVTILIGGIASLIVSRLSKTKEEEEDSHNRGVLVSSGLIAGEAITGIIVGLIITAKPGLFPIHIIESNILTAFAFGVIILGLISVSLKGKKT